jgi:ATP-dependent RNA helicase RhlE
MDDNNFEALGIIEPIRRALETARIAEPTPVQREAIPLVLAGHDVVGSAQTGSGKTAAYALPMLQRLLETRTSPVRGSARALVLAPTRELAVQIADCFTSFGINLSLRVATVYGGVSRNEQIQELARGVDILVATPGRLLDLMGERRILLGRVEVLVLDEADRMMDMGFLPDIRKIAAALPERRQTLLFSATMPTLIWGLAASLLRQPRNVEITPARQEDPMIEQKVLFVNGNKKNALLIRLLADRSASRALVFTRTKRRAENLSRFLAGRRVKSDALHSDKTQGARKKALDSFHTGRIRVLVATDIAARGIDVDDIDLVINYELPLEPGLYIHRIGRTARAGKQGTALSFCDASEVVYLRQIEKELKKRLPVWESQPYHSPDAAAGRSPADQPRMRRSHTDRPHTGRSPASGPRAGNSSSRKSSKPDNWMKSRSRFHKSTEDRSSSEHARAVSRQITRG